MDEHPPAGYYDYPDGTGRRRYWDGAEWRGWSDPAESLPPATQAPDHAEYDQRKWEQDPSGNWHRKSRAGNVTAWVLLALVAAGIAGGMWWNKHQHDERVEREGQELTCALLGEGPDC